MAAARGEAEAERQGGGTRTAPPKVTDGGGPRCFVTPWITTWLLETTLPSSIPLIVAPTLRWRTLITRLADHALALHRDGLPLTLTSPHAAM